MPKPVPTIENTAISALQTQKSSTLPPDNVIYLEGAPAGTQVPLNNTVALKRLDGTRTDT